MELTVTEIAKRLNAELIGPGQSVIRSIGPAGSADQATLTFLANDKHLAELEKSRAGAVIVNKAIEGLLQSQLLVKNVNAALIEALKIFAPKLQPAVPGVDSTAKVAPGVKIGKNVSIGPFAVIENGVELGDDTIIAAGCKIGQNTKIGRATRLDCNVVVYHNCTIGNNVIIQANTTIGSVGFGYSFIDGAHRLIPHNGVVVIEDYVEIGANSCVDRAKFGETRIGAGTKIDNLVQIAHNVVIGEYSVIVSQVGISGSTKLGKSVIIGGQAGLVGHINIGDNVSIGAQSGVHEDVSPGTIVSGSPHLPHREWLRVVSCLSRLPNMRSTLSLLGNKVDKLEEELREKLKK
jgi:UDP-3-O-[3-hydroxymyristoyl] glucosamine N-acyltransferase